MDQTSWNAQESRVDSLIASAVVFLLVCVVVVGLRFYIRLRVIRKFGNDDIALAVTLVRILEFVLGWHRAP